MHANLVFVAYLSAIVLLLTVAFLIASNLESRFGFGVIWFPLLFLPTLATVATLTLRWERSTQARL